jgi:hypothetical protein
LKPAAMMKAIRARLQEVLVGLERLMPQSLL